MVPAEDYEFFLVGELPQRFWKTYRTMTGMMKMRVARGFIAAGETETVEQTYIESPAPGAGKLLVGRMILNRHQALLDGPRRLTCFVETQPTTA
jgi:hypothetical protein